jgi:hypothetical protein
MVSAVADDACARNEFLATAAEIDRGEQFSAGAEDQKAHEGLIAVDPGTHGVVHGNAGNEVLVAHGIVDRRVDIGLTGIHQLLGRGGGGPR